MYDAVIDATPDSEGTTTGTGLFVIVAELIPSAPWSLPPQAQTVPSRFDAIEWRRPAPMAMTSVKPTTGTAVSRGCEIVPSPISPLLLYPHATTVPSDFRATVWA